MTKLVAFVQLTKPRIIELLLITTVPTMVVADRGWPSTWLVLATVIGGTLAAGGANAMNCYFDRDIDEIMQRTRGRPLPEARVQPSSALLFGIALEVVSFVWLSLFVNVLSALLAVSATAFYVGVYTLWLKRTTSQNIVIGGAAGAVPVLVGWAAVTGTVGAPAWVMFAVIFLWTPPHFWALAVKYREDYRAAGVPMLPAVAGIGVVARQVLLYSVALVAVSLLVQPVADLGWIYVAVAVAIGAAFIWFAIRLYRERTERSAMRLFGWSITYLGVLFVAMAADTLVIA